MKNIIKSTLLLVGIATLFTACKDDRDSNPTLLTPDSFVLNTPAYAAAGIDLASSETLNFTWSQPNYGIPVAATYQLLISRDGNHTKSLADVLAAEEDPLTADYALVDAAFSQCNGTIGAAVVARTLQQMFQFQQDAMPERQEFYVIASAVTEGRKTIYSNPVKLSVVPYYIELKAAEPVLWYFVGSGFANVDWNTGKIGEGLIPLLPMPDAEFDMNGLGILSYTGFFPAGAQFKFIRDYTGSDPWNPQLNFTNVDSPDDAIISDLDGDNHNIGINKDGYYTVEMNTATNKITITKLDITPGVYDTVTMPGSYQNWNPAENAMTPITSVVENHLWMADVTFDADAPSDGGVKFANGTWDVNWGAADFPMGTGTQGGANIPFKAGSWRVYFNDISGDYYFVAQ